MDWWFLSFLTGALLSLFLPIVPVLFSITLILIVIVDFIRSKKLFVFTAFLCGFLLVQAFGYNQHNKLTQLPIAKEQLHLKAIWLTGIVDSVVADTSEIQKFTLLINELDGQTVDVKLRAKLRWKDAELSLVQGDKLRVLARVKPAHGFANPGGFNYQAWLFVNRISLTGYIKEHSDNQRLLHNKTIRQSHYNRMNELFSFSSLKPLFLAITVGDKQLISDNQWQILSATGTQHLMAISGLHLALVASASYLLCTLVIRMLPFTPLLANQLRYVPIIVSFLVAVSYAAIAGFATPTVRALVMIAIFYLSKLMKVHLTVTRFLLLSAVIVILLNPLAMLEVGFWLSFSAVTIIFCSLWLTGHFTRKYKAWRRYLIGLVVIQAAISIIMMPLLALFFQQVSFSSPIANLIAVPVLSFTVIPIALFASVSVYVSPWLALQLAILSDAILQWVWQFLATLSSLEFALVPLNWPTIVMGLLALSLVAVVATSYRNKHLLLLSTLVIGVNAAALGVSHYWQVQQGIWRVNVLDVGHGLAVVIEKNDRLLLYDTGACYPSGFCIAESIIHPYLHTKRIDKIDHLIVSHSDNDHSGGLNYLLENQLVDTVIANVELPSSSAVSLVSANVTLPKVRPCDIGSTLKWQGLNLKFIWSGNTPANENDDSCVVVISDGKYRVLLTGDVSAKVEKQLLIAGQLSAVDVLVAPHHGSKSSSSLAFVKATQAKHIIFSSGYLNRWNMPNPKVVARYQSIGSRVHTTATDGMVTVEVNQHGLKTYNYRQDHLPFWFANELP